MNDDVMIALREVWAMCRERRYADALARLEEDRNAASLALKIELGKVLSILGDDARAQTVLDEVERNSALMDADEHRLAHLAYSSGAGLLPPDDCDQRAFAHLLAAANQGDQADDARAVAAHYAHGLNGVGPDAELAMKWGEIARQRSGHHALQPAQ